MKTLISNTSNFNSVPQASSVNLIFQFPSLARANPRSISFCCRKWNHRPKTLSFCFVQGANSVGYGGWDDPRLGGDSDSGESNQLRALLRSLGIDDKKYIFVYLFGFICALAISRVRVSSIVVFPATVIVLAVGFSIGFVNGGHVNELSSMGTKKRPKIDDFSVSVEKLRKLVDLFDGLDFRISNVKSDIRRGIESNHISVEDLESYVRVMESIGVSASNARVIVETCIRNIESQEVERTINQKSSRRNKPGGEMGFNLLRFVGGLFLEKPVDSKAIKVKDSGKRDLARGERNNHHRGNILASEKRSASTSSSNRNLRSSSVDLFEEATTEPNLLWDSAEKLSNEATRRGAFAEHGEINFLNMGNNAERILHGKQYSSFNKEVLFVNNQRISMKMGHHNEVETQSQQSSFLDSLDFRVNVERVETEASFGQEQVVHKTKGSTRHSHSQGNEGNESYEVHSREEEWVPSKDGPSMADQPFENKSGPVISDDIVFNRYLMEATALLKEARECLRVNQDERYSENILKKSAELLSKAIDMKPMSLLAVGQLGNTYLLHGELKLKISRKLRNQIARGDQVAGRDKIALLLINVCEECEELLVEAGRKYRFALTIDGNDMKALYNWGLALSFRAQLIADIGPEAAFDADKVFLAAIDKFDAMMSKSNAYAPDALFRWAVTLQQRSRLRPRNNKEKVKLLQQAKRLYEDALDMDSNNVQVREALSSCISELDYRSYY